MSTITSEEIDDFVDLLSKKRCKGPKGYLKTTLSSGTVKKCYTVLTAGFPTAKKWGYISEIPETTAPVERSKKRRAWEPKRVYEVLDAMQDDKFLHLAVHIAFVCSLRAGETAGIDIGTLDFPDASLWITQQLQRVSDKSLAELPKHQIIRVFPKRVRMASTTLILKGPKTEESYRKQYLTAPLLVEILERLEEIREHKDFFREEYEDYGLLICQPDGKPVDPKSLDKRFKAWQTAYGIAPKDQIEFQGLRKSGQMHKVRLTQNNYQLVAANSGQSPEVLMSNYNEVLDSEKRALAQMIEKNFYPQPEPISPQPTQDVAAAMQAIRQNPDLTRQLLQILLLDATPALQGARC